MVTAHQCQFPRLRCGAGQSPAAQAGPTRILVSYAKP
jgi:hypothetical protein